MPDDLTSRPFKPDAAKCCERCVFGTGVHAAFCKLAKRVRKQREALAAVADVIGGLTQIKEG